MAVEDRIIQHERPAVRRRDQRVSEGDGACFFASARDGVRTKPNTRDAGPGSVDAWLADLVGAEITAEEFRASKMLDVDGRELVLASGRVNLTSLEFGVMQYLQDHPGKAVSRYDLMEAVWGYRNETASNVVDVVVRSLRRKLGVESSVVETVRGTGYRYRMPASAP